MEPKLIELKNGPEDIFKEQLELRKNQYYSTLYRLAYLTIWTEEEPSSEVFEKEYRRSFWRMMEIESELESVGVLFTENPRSSE
ncbi:hypothetical protein H1S01_09850 [Heliobacterium chlorum]|uniref:Uncharacterized protein n=1 Tax=Heliobacterium chlorum TaxID=2698 RepID=A0ABR7T216_HELCL|nr:hypothetical protein [Heliobacterium chlorum]MBC9784814.1 hypothetical protein [Heliobacterium chlorum]